MEKFEYANMFNFESDMWWYKGLRDLLFFYIKKYSNNDINTKILDAGCGTGKNLEVFNLNGYKAYGLDFSEEAINFCKKRNLNNVLFGDICNIPFQEKYFDILICMDVLGNLGNNETEKAIKEFRRVLKDDGIAIINCAALEIFRSQHDDVIHTKKRFSKKDLEIEFKKSNFIILKSSYRVFFLSFPILIVKMIKRIFRSKNKPPSSDQWMPPALINNLLFKIQYAENKLIKRFNLFFGSSVFLIVKKQNIN
jgi:SAM-dependent methyltransferase